MERWQNIILAFGLLALWGAGFFYYSQFTPQKCSGDEFWDMVLAKGATIVNETKSQFDVAIQERHGLRYFKVDKNDAARDYPASIWRHVERLVARIKEERRIFGKPSGYWIKDLALITGVNLGDDPADWAEWCGQQAGKFKPKSETYQDLDQAALEREKERGNAAALEKRTKLALDYKENRLLSRILLASLLLPTLVIAFMSWAKLVER